MPAQGPSLLFKGCWGTFHRLKADHSPHLMPTLKWMEMYLHSPFAFITCMWKIWPLAEYQGRKWTSTFTFFSPNVSMLLSSFLGSIQNACLRVDYEIATEQAGSWGDVHGLYFGEFRFQLREAPTVMTMSCRGFPRPVEATMRMYLEIVPPTFRFTHFPIHDTLKKTYSVLLTGDQ